MRLQVAFLILICPMLCACNTTSTNTGGSSPPGDADPHAERGIVGQWKLKATDSVLSCRVKVSGKNEDLEGYATDFGCIGMDDFFMIRRWKRERGTVAFFRIADNRPVASVYRVGRNEFRGELLPSGRKIVLTRQ